jgi:hypothetical protein
MEMMMRWCYKTVHYELKKEGFLGSAFLDEAEVEQSLNDYGKAGWELVSIMETQDGLIAVFKQPLEPVVRETEPLTVGQVITNDVLLENESEDIITEEDIIKDEIEEDDIETNNGLRSIRIE